MSKRETVALRGLWLIAVLLGACNLTAAPTATPLPTVSVPLVEFLEPSADLVVAEGTEIQIVVLARDPGGAGIARVVLLVDDQPHKEAEPVASAADAVCSGRMNWLAIGAGLHSFEATAYRADGTASTPVALRVEVVAAADAGP
ncbi:MAG: hypothetical protein GYB67_12825 [Chloroflexi bacterium]|nr:hypothetical protein [Chloroflexota bacterium]